MDALKDILDNKNGLYMTCRTPLLKGMPVSMNDIFPSIFKNILSCLVYTTAYFSHLNFFFQFFHLHFPFSTKTKLLFILFLDV